MDAWLIRRPWQRRNNGGLPALRFAIVGLSTILFGLAGAVLAIAGGLWGVYAFYAQGLPSPEEISRRSIENFETTRIYDRTGQHILYEIIPPEGGRRTEVPLARIPVHLRNATIAMEDKTFYTNPGGINIEGLARAVWGTLRGQYAGGGSSIPQQLIRNVIMTPEERMEMSYNRKIKELILAIELTRRYPGVEGRDKILEWYLNNVFYGHFAYGVEAAAQTYFNKHVEELTLAEAAMLVPLGNAPALNPIDHPEEAKKRQEIVLDQMYLQGYITAEEAFAAKQQPLVIAPPRFDIVAPHYVLWIRNLLEEQFGSDAVYGGGLQVITALDLEIQNKAQEIARTQVASFREKYKASNAAVVVLDAKTAEVKAMVGSLDYFDRSIDGQINMALSPRQPGSSFKPFTYATAFAQGYTPATMVMDVRTSFPDPPNPEPYVPENYSRNYHGPMLLRQALACSYNIPAVAIASKVGIPNVVATARAMGITTLTKPTYGLALTLGGTEVPLLDMAYAFSVFANGGTMVGEEVPPEKQKPGYRQLEPVGILKVTDAKGQVLYEYTQPKKRGVLSPEVAFLLTDILSDNRARTPAFGADSVLVIKDRPAAVKTGTTDEYRDGWTIGYTPQYVVGVWVGNTDYTEMEKGAAGVRTAGPIWHDLMEWLHADLPVENFTRPPNLETAIIEPKSGKLPTEYSPSRMQEIFIQGTVPTEHDDVHRPFRICKETGKLATVYCPQDQVEVKVFEIYPPEADDWVRENQIPQPPREYCDLHGPNLVNADVAIVSPKNLQIVRGLVPIMGNARAGGQEKFWLEFGQGLTPGAWLPMGPEHGHRVENNVLEYWDTTGLDGLYTLRLSVIDGGNLRQASLNVLVDNISPTVSIIHPPDGKVYEMNKDEWVNIQVDAQDNIAMSRVEFFLDERSLGFSTVAPYTLRWTLVMSNTQPVKEETRPLPPGMEIIANAGGYTETHTIYVVAYDAAGNQMKSEPVKVQIIPERKDKDKRTSFALPIWRREEIVG